MTSMTHPSINQRGRDHRAEVRSGIFLTSTYPAFIALLFSAKLCFTLALLQGFSAGSITKIFD